jgi:hypothetical protein
VNPLGRGAGRLGRAGRTPGGVSWAALWIQPKRRFLNKKLFSFSNLFYKLQINLNSNQI